MNFDKIEKLILERKRLRSKLNEVVDLQTYDPKTDNWVFTVSVHVKDYPGSPPSILSVLGPLEYMPILIKKEKEYRTKLEEIENELKEIQK